jgi:CBS domain-containing protein
MPTPMPTPTFVREIMSRRIGTVDATATIEAMRKLAQRDDLLAVAVVNHHQPIAVLTRQNLDHADPRTTEPDTTPWFEQFGGQPSIVLAPDDLIAGLETVFYQSGTTSALVVDHHEVVGLVTLSQLTEEGSSQVPWRRADRSDQQPDPVVSLQQQGGHDDRPTMHGRPRTPAAAPRSPAFARRP